MRYLDGLRGLAALQVVAFHYASVLLPAALGEGYLSYLSNGFSAVCLFFLLSGMVLTYSFERTPFAVGIGIARRIVRLGIPLSAAALFAGAICSINPNIGTVASQLAHAPWSHGIYTGPHDFLHIAADASGFTTLFGYEQTSIFSGLQPFLSPHHDSADQPLWSLHLELWGSFLVLAFVYTRAWSPWFYGAVLAVAAVLVGVHPLWLFIAGHVAAVLLAQPSVKALLGRRWTVAAGFFLLAVGVTVCTHPRLPAIYGLARVMNSGSILPPLAPWSVELGSVVIFAGVLLASPVHTILRTRPVQLLGRLSFPIYLLHWPIMTTVDAALFVAALPRLGEVPAALLALTIGSAVTLGLADLFERYVDAPAVALSRRLRTRSQVAALPVE